MDNNGSIKITSFYTMWKTIFTSALLSSIVIHTCAALIAFVTLRKHKFGRFFSIFILVMGFVTPATIGVIYSAVVALVAYTGKFHLTWFYAILLGVGQTLVFICFGFTRILAML